MHTSRSSDYLNPNVPEFVPIINHNLEETLEDKTIPPVINGSCESNPSSPEGTSDEKSSSPVKEIVNGEHSDNGWQEVRKN